MKSFPLRRLPAVLGAIAGCAALGTGAAHAQIFALQPNTAFGIVQLASFSTVAGGAGAVFGNDGVLDEAGGFYPELNVINQLGATSGLVALPIAQASGPVGTFGGGVGTLFAVQGNSAGILTNNFSVTDAVLGDGDASSVLMYGTGSWTYNGNAPALFVGGAFITMSASVDPNDIGSYVEAGVDTLFSVNGNAVGAPTIVFGFDGVPNVATGYAGGPLASFINAGVYSYVANGPSVTFSAASYTSFILNPGDTLTLQGTLTEFADPASIEYIDNSSFDNGNDDAGVSAAAPEPGTFALLLPVGMTGALGIVRRYRRSPSRKS